MKAFLLSFILIISLMLIFVGVLLHIPLHKNKNLEGAILQIQSVLFIAFPLACFSILLAVFSINPLICSIVWIVIIWFCKRFSLSKMSILISVDTKVAMSFLAMLLCAIYFVIRWLVDYKEGFSSYYFEMLCVMLSVMLGFFVPINVLLSDVTPFEFLKRIIEETKIYILKKSAWVTFAVTAFFFVIQAVVENISLFKKHMQPLTWGFISGIIVAIPIMSVILKCHRNAIKDCSDIRQTFYEGELFLVYQKKIEDFLGYSHKERYDYVEALFFYEAYTESLDKQMLYEVDSLRIVCEHFKRDYKYYNEMDIVKRYEWNDNIYILKKGNKRYCGDVMTSPWPLVLEYLRAYSELDLENRDIPLRDKERYLKSGFNGNKEMWLLYFFERYHRLSDKEKEKIVPKEMKSFVYYAYHEKAIWAIPIGCDAGKMQYAIGPSGSREKYDFGDLTLQAIYRWYCMKKDGLEKARESFAELYEKSSGEVGIWEKWLLDFKDWNDFVVSNNLQNLVNQKRSIDRMDYREPIMFFRDHSAKKVLPQTKVEWLEMFKKIAELIYSRY